MKLTGERFIPEYSGDWSPEHYHRYALALYFVQGKRVLDVSSGEGYGSALLAQRARWVTGVDISVEAIAHARQKYAMDNLEYLCGCATALPLSDAAVDVVISFETLEHLGEHEAMLSEIRRVLVPQGLLLLSSPDKRLYSDIPRYTNHYHVKELYEDELVQLLESRFTQVKFFRQNLEYGSLIVADAPSRFQEIEQQGTSFSWTEGLPHGKYIIAVASNSLLPEIPNSLLRYPLSSSEDVLRAEEHVERLKTELSKVEVWNANLRASVATLSSELESENHNVRQLQARCACLFHEKDVLLTESESLLREKEALLMRYKSLLRCSSCRPVALLRTSNPFFSVPFAQQVIDFLMFLTVWAMSSDLTACRLLLRAEPTLIDELMDDPDLVVAAIAKENRTRQKIACFALNSARAIRVRNGLVPTLKVCWRILREESWLGLRRRLFRRLPLTEALQKALEEAPVVHREDGMKVLVMDYRVPGYDVAPGEQLTWGMLHDLVQLGFDVTFMPANMHNDKARTEALRVASIKVITRDDGFDTPADFLLQQGYIFGLFYLPRLEMAEEVMDIMRKVSPEGRIILHTPDLSFLREQKNAADTDDKEILRRVERITLRESALLRKADCLFAMDEEEAEQLRKCIFNMLIVPFPWLHPVQNTTPCADNKGSQTDVLLWETQTENGLEQRYSSRRENTLTFVDTLQHLRRFSLEGYCALYRYLPPASLDTRSFNAIDVSIVVPVYNQWRYTRACLNSLIDECRRSGLAFEIILADDGSTDATVYASKEYPGIHHVKTEKNVGFLRNCNNGARNARGKYILFVNNDTLILPGWLSELYKTAESSPRIAITGSKMLSEDGVTVQEAGGALFSDATGMNIGRWMHRTSPVLNEEREADYISGCSILVRKSFWDEVGGFDTRYETAYFEDADLAMEAHARGLRVVYQPRSEIIHLEGLSYQDRKKDDLMQANKQRFIEKWSEQLTKHLPNTAMWDVVMYRAGELYAGQKDESVDS